MSMKVMRNMVDDIRNELHKRKCTVLCEVYDGQFHPIIVRSRDDKPLTRIQMTHQHFKDTLKNNSREDLVNILLPYSEISPSDLEILNTTRFQNERTVCMDSITLDMRRTISKLNNRHVFIHQCYIYTNKVGNFSMENIVTHHRQDIWMKYLGKYKEMYSKYSTHSVQLSENDLRKIIKGTKLHRRIIHRKSLGYDESENSDSDDPDYEPSQEESEFSDLSEEDILDGEETSLHNVSTVSTTSTGTSCIKQILNELRKIDNKHK